MSGFRVFLTKGKIIVASIVVLATFLGIGGMIWWVMSQPETPVGEGSDESTRISRENAEAYAKQAEEDSKLREEATKSIRSKNPAAAQKTYQTAIDKETSLERKTLLYIDLSQAYYLEGDYAKAIEVAKQAETQNPDKYLISDWLSRLYEDSKDYVNAAKYYRQAGEWATSEQNKTAITKDMYETKAQKMDALAKGGAQ